MFEQNGHLKRSAEDQGPSKKRSRTVWQRLMVSGEAEAAKNTEQNRAEKEHRKLVEKSGEINGVSKEANSKRSIPREEEIIFLRCRTARIGSYKVHPTSEVVITSIGMQICVPSCSDGATVVTLFIDMKEIGKVMGHFSRKMPVLFFDVQPSAAAKICGSLNMNSEHGPYFDPTSQDASQKFITLFPGRTFNTDEALVLKTIFTSSSVLRELNFKEANDILMGACRKESVCPLHPHSPAKGASMVANSPSEEVSVVAESPPQAASVISSVPSENTVIVTNVQLEDTSHAVDSPPQEAAIVVNAAYENASPKVEECVLVNPVSGQLQKMSVVNGGDHVQVVGLSPYQETQQLTRIMGQGETYFMPPVPLQRSSAAAGVCIFPVPLMAGIPQEIYIPPIPTVTAPVALEECILPDAVPTSPTNVTTVPLVKMEAADDEVVCLTPYKQSDVLGQDMRSLVRHI